MRETLKQRLVRLYTGDGPGAVRFRYGLIAFDALTILFFIVSAPFALPPPYQVLSVVIGLLIALDFAARMWIAEDRWALLGKIYTLADLVVILSLLADPFHGSDVAFLRILRGLRLIHSYYLLADLRRDSRFFRQHEDAVIAVINLFVFVFTTASAAYVFFFGGPGGEYSFVDALYFTVATLTTTGFGDITMTTPAGKMFTVFVMVVGVTLFVQLARAIMQPAKVYHTCPDCGLSRHDLDAVHCKHCGNLLHIKTRGAD